jgi:hypothetical protein
MIIIFILIKKLNFVKKKKKRNKIKMILINQELLNLM